jgi:hypothetical protein
VLACDYLTRKEITSTHEQSDSLALAAIIIGWTMTAITVLNTPAFFKLRSLFDIAVNHMAHQESGQLLVAANTLF